MTKFAQATKSTTAVLERPRGAIKTKTQKPNAVTENGADGFTRKAKSELFLLAVTNMVGESTFYEAGKARDERFANLIHKVTEKDPDWIARFVPYLRDTLNMRTAAIVMAAEYVKAGGPNGRAVIDSALARAEEPSVLIGYWKQFYGAKDNGGVRLPKPIKRGVADAILRLYSEKSLIKYDAETLSPRFGDVVELVHPSATTEWQRDLFAYAIGKRHNRDRFNIENLPTISKYRSLLAMPIADRRALINKAADGDESARASLEDAGLTWENLSGWLQGPMDASAWTAIIPQMRYMAILRNLRNFDEAKVSDEVADQVIAKITDPDEVAASRQLPLRFLASYKANAASTRWARALEKAVNLSLANVPALSGKTLILVDDSASMDVTLSDKSTVKRREAAALFGAALALRADSATLVAYANEGINITIPKGGSVLPLANVVSKAISGGTRTMDVLAKFYENHDRTIILTDEQTSAPLAASRLIVDQIASPVYTFNLAGLKVGQFPASGERPRYTFGGLTDQSFRAIQLLEAGQNETWPF